MLDAYREVFQGARSSWRLAAEALDHDLDFVEPEKAKAFGVEDEGRERIRERLKRGQCGKGEAEEAGRAGEGEGGEVW